MPDQPKPRKTMILVTDDEWRALRIAAATEDTSIQGYVTAAVLRRLTDDGHLKRGSLNPARPRRGRGSS